MAISGPEKHCSGQAAEPKADLHGLSRQPPPCCRRRLPIKIHLILSRSVYPHLFAHSSWRLPPWRPQTRPGASRDPPRLFRDPRIARRLPRYFACRHHFDRSLGLSGFAMVEAKGWWLRLAPGDGMSSALDGLSLPSDCRAVCCFDVLLRDATIRRFPRFCPG